MNKYKLNVNKNSTAKKTNVVEQGQTPLHRSKEMSKKEKRDKQTEKQKEIQQYITATIVYDKTTTTISNISYKKLEEKKTIFYTVLHKVSLLTQRQKEYIFDKLSERPSEGHIGSKGSSEKVLTLVHFMADDV